jgi:hypothetical protein
MKKQNVNNKLAFKKVAITELNDNQLNDIQGGTSYICSAVAVIFTAGVIQSFFNNLTKK